MSAWIIQLAEIAPLLGLVFFFGVFAGIACWVLTPSCRGMLETYARIPLQESSHDRA